MVKPVPEGYHTVTPYIIVDGGAKALDFYARAFGATERLRIPGAGGRSATPRSRSAIPTSCWPTSIPRSGR